MRVFITAMALVQNLRTYLFATKMGRRNAQDESVNLLGLEKGSNDSGSSVDYCSYANRFLALAQTFEGSCYGTGILILR